MASTNRHLKIFISSTFEDMNQEGDSLLKDISLHIKKEARKRDVEITEIDLRWGVNTDDSFKGQTVKVCLDETNIMNYKILLSLYLKFWKNYIK